MDTPPSIEVRLEACDYLARLLKVMEKSELIEWDQLKAYDDNISWAGDIVDLSMHSQDAAKYELCEVIAAIADEAQRELRLESSEPAQDGNEVLRKAFSRLRAEYERVKGTGPNAESCRLA